MIKNCINISYVYNRIWLKLDTIYMIPNICTLSQVHNGFNISHDYKSIIHHMIRMDKENRSYYAVRYNLS